MSLTAFGGEPMSFTEKLYPVFQSAGCRTCHNPDGVASPTRLRFPEEGAPKDRVAAFGRSLVELVDRQSPDASLLVNKPTNRIKHSGGERIRQGSPEEALLKTWVRYLASLSGSDLQRALDYKQQEAAGSAHMRAPQVVLRLMTHRQYNNTVHDLLKEPSNAASQFPAEDYVNGFKNQYESKSLTPIQAEAYSASAERMAANAFRRGDSRHLIPCAYDGDHADECRLQFIESFGLQAFRRPLAREETARFIALFRAQSNFLQGAQTVVEAILQSPSFLYWMEQTPIASWKPYATASRLSYFIWDTMPDESLLALASRGELNTAPDIERAARRMLADPRAHESLDDFVSQWLRFDRVLTASRDHRVYKLFNQDLAVAMTEEARQFVADLVWNDRNFMNAFTSNYGFVNSDLAAVYRVPPPAREYERVTYPPGQERAGLLGQALFLTLTSKLDETAPTGRGLFVREQFLCQHVPPPPPGVDTNLPVLDQQRPLNNRERLASHTGNKTCAGCHHLIDPIGFGLEKFDAIGMYREKQKLTFYPELHGLAARKAKPVEIELAIDTTGQVAGVGDPQFNGARQLGELLARTPQCQECVVKQVFRYMSGRLESRADTPMINRALEQFRDSGFRYRELIVSLVKQWHLSERAERVASDYQTH